jgi:hypothetical protein
MNHPTNQPTN